MAKSQERAMWIKIYLLFYENTFQLITQSYLILASGGQMPLVPMLSPMITYASVIFMVWTSKYYT